jgi:hypothetical protein
MNFIASRLRLSAKPSAIHLGISFTIALLAMAVIFLLWYPGELAQLQGVSSLVLIMIGVDVVIGPLITLIIFVPGKKSLRFDLTVIAALQTGALFYGLQTIHGGRPAYVVFSVDRFDVVAYQNVDRGSLERGAYEMKVSPLKPKWAGARMPDDPKLRSDILVSALRGGPDLQHLPEYFLPLEDLRGEMLAQLRPMDELRTLNGLDPATWQSLLTEFGRTEYELGYLPIVGNAMDGAVMLDARTGEMLGIRLLTPSFKSPHKQEGSGGAAPSGPVRTVG